MSESQRKMTDREKVVKGLDICINAIHTDCPIGCPYYEQCTKWENRYVFQPMLRDALALLKEQETVVRCKDCKHYMTMHCNCGGCFISDDWFCADGERR